MRGAAFVLALALGWPVAAGADLPPADSHLIFVTSIAYDGALGGLVGADALCSAHASSGALTAFLDRTWRALLSSYGVVDARDRIHWAASVYDVSGLLVTNDPSTWPWVKDGTSTIGVNENGGPPSDFYAWTGSHATGISVGAGYDCGGWTSSSSSSLGWAGESDSFGSSSWFDSFSNTCDSAYFSLYCVSYVEGTVFIDGFETGSTGVWSSSMP